MAGFHVWSATPGSNTTVDGISIAEGMSPANVNNAMRSIMALIKASVTSALENFLLGSAALPIANGGHAGTTAPAGLANLGGLGSAYKGLPFTAKTAAFTLAIADEGIGYRYTGAAAAATIDPVATTAYTVGAVIPIRNAHNSTGAVTITRGAGVSLRLAGSTTDANAVVAVGGMANLIHETTNVWICIPCGGVT